MGWISGLAGLLVVLTGRSVAVPNDMAYDVAVTWGVAVLVFLMAITVLSELSERAGALHPRSERSVHFYRDVLGWRQVIGGDDDPLPFPPRPSMRPRTGRTTTSY